MATQTGTQAPGGAKPPFPPFDKETFGSQLIWLVIAFVALYVLLARVALPRVAAIFAARKKTLESNLAAAAKAKAESEAAIASYEKSLAEARAKSQALAAETKAKFAAEAEEKKKKLEADLATKLAAAEKQIDATRKTAMGNVRGIAVDTASAIVERLTGTAPAKPAVEKAVDAALH
jgi:F-type H+-transporting ATPase subunit b